MGAGLDAAGLAVATVAYNRDAYANNISMNQNQMYQEKNYLIAFITALREELRDVMSIFVGRMSNYILVSTLLFGFAVVLYSEGPAFMEDGDSPRVLVQIFSISIGLTLVAHMCCILVAFKGLAAVYEQAMKCLAEFTPEEPDEYTFNYLEQCTFGFEQSGEVWRLPLTDYPWWCLPQPLRSRWPRRAAVKDWTTRKDCHLQCPKVAEQKHIMEELPRKRWKHAPAEAGESPEDSASKDNYFNDYFKHIQTLTGAWEPHKDVTKVILAHSVMENTQALAYFSLGRYHKVGLHFSAVLCLMLTSLGMVVMWQLRGWLSKKGTLWGSRGFLAVVLLTAAGPVVCALVLPFLHPDLHSILGMLCSLPVMLREVCLIILVPHGQENKRRPTSITSAGFDDMQKQDPRKSAQFVESGRSSRELHDEPQNRGEFVDHLKSVVQDCSHADVVNVDHLGPAQRKIVRAFGGFTCFWWAISFALFAVGLHEALEGRRQGHASAAVVIGSLDVTWPSNHFLPRALGCDGGHVFIADEFNIYELVASQTQTFHLQPWPCYLTRRVADIAVSCDKNGACQPLALLQGLPSEVVDCAASNEAPLTLLQAATHVEHMAAWNSTRILTVEGKDVLLRTRSQVNQRNIFKALWPTAEVPQSQNGMLRAVDSANGRMLSFFFGGGTEFRPAVVRHEVASNVSLTWELPSDLPVLLTGCTPTQDSILVVASSDSSPQRLKIVRLELEPQRL
jgi:hypothetical protein